MIIVRTSKKVIIRLSTNVDTEGLQQLVDHLTCKEAKSTSKAKQSDVDKLSKEVKEGWWAKNKSRLVLVDTNIIFSTLLNSNSTS